ncbi:MAG: DUF1080 domain-containing protein [Phycisphaerae bacterium]|jgi:hypothetical protein|nr:DUF1080 domain-containing protein [Phycisphaerae bacterium]
MTIKRYIGVIIILAVAAPIFAADVTLQNVDEQKLIAVLKSEAPLYDKTQACQKLAIFGSAKAVPPLADLLGDKALGDYARIALEPMKFPSVDVAFRAALGKLKGRPLVGVITSIGVRRDAKAVGVLRKLVSDKDKDVAAATLGALGRIATDEATGAILQTLAKGPAALRTPAADAALVAAKILLDAGKKDSAVSLYDAVGKAEVPVFVRTSSVYGAILARGAKGLPLLVKQLNSNDPALIAIALRAARELPGPEVSLKLAAEMPKASPAIQAMLIKTLTDRGDPSARKAIAALASSKTAAVRLESLKALGAIGDAGAIPVLLKAADAEGPEAKVALVSMRSIDGEGVGAAILKGMTGAKGELRVDLISVLSDRRYAPAAKPVLSHAGSTDATLAKAAFKALGVLADQGDIPAMIKHMPTGDSNPAAAQAEASIIAVAAKTTDPSKRADGVLAALASEKKPQRQASLVRILGKIGGDKALAAVVKSNSTDAAVRALAGWPDGKAAGPLLDIVKNTKDKTHRILALRGYIRLLGLDPDAPVRKYAEALDLAKQPETKKLVLSGIAGVVHSDALKLVVPLLDDKAVRGEAALAAVSIARATMGADRKQARATMEKVQTAMKGKPLAAEAQRVIRQIDLLRNCITAWRITGPYSKKGKTYRELLGIPFAPETPGATDVVWRRIPTGTDPKRPHILDLTRTVGGNQKVAYALTWIHVDKAFAARLDLGSDDGVKAWLNGKLVHTNNVARAAIPYTDKVPVTLRAGWNPLMLKITQNNGPCEFCAQVVTRKGKPIEGLRVDPGHKGDWTLPAEAPPLKSEKLAPAGKAVRIFDGKTFDGWEGNLKSFRIEDGAIVGGTLKAKIPRNEFLCTKKKYSDFELRLKVKLAGGRGNAGIQIRTRRIPNHHEVSGYQADMGQNWWGCLYDESRRNKVLARPKKAELAKVLKADGWNEYIIRCVGPRIQLFFNGLKTVDYTERDAKIATTGIIGLQIHGGRPSEAWYKDITIVDLSAPAEKLDFVSLFDGKSLKGWKPTMKPRTDAQKAAIGKMFRAENGAIVVDTLSLPVKDRMGGYLATEKKYGDFVMRCKMQIERKWDRQGNSGIEVRNGLQFDLHPPEPSLTGWVWDHGPRSTLGWLAPIKVSKKKSFAGGAWKYGKTRKAPKGFKFHYADQPPGWNDVEITCRGLQFKFKLNSVVMSDFDGTGYLDKPDRKDYQTTAPIMFQSHGKDGVIIRYKNIEIAELPAAKSK